MIETLLKLFKPDAAIPDDATTQLVWSNMPSGLMAFVTLAIIAAGLWGVFYMYRREMDSCPPAMRIGLAVIRCAVLLLLVAIVLNPVVDIAKQSIKRPYVLLLVDNSASMGDPDLYQDEALLKQVVDSTGLSEEEVKSLSRAKIVEHLLKKEEGKFIRELAEKGRLIVKSFAGSLEDIPVYAEAKEEAIAASEAEESEAVEGEEALLSRQIDLSQLNLSANGQSTDIADAVRKSLASLPASSSVAAVVLITDGANNTGDLPTRAAAFAKEKYEAPVYTVGIGDPSPPQEVRVLDLVAPANAFKDDPMEVNATLSFKGLGSQTVPIEIVIQQQLDDGSLGAEEIIHSENILIDEDTAEKKINKEYEPTKSGKFIITARVQADAVPGDIIKTDNLKQQPIRILRDKARVLLLAGGPSWEYRMVTALLKRDKNIELSVWLQSLGVNMSQDGNKIIEKLPRTEEELSEYDVVIWMDANAEIDNFTRDDIISMQQYLNNGGGLLFMAGPAFSDRFINWPDFGDELAKVLPVSFQDLTSKFNDLIKPHVRSFPLRLTPDGQDHPLLRLDKQPLRNKAIWESLPQIYWTFPAHSTKPGMTALMEYGNPAYRKRVSGIMQGRPLLVAGQFGPGRVVYMGFNGTWRWRQVGERYFDQYWIQMVRYLIEGKLLADQKRGRLLLDQDEYIIGTRVQLSAVLQTAQYEPLEDEEVIAQINAGTDFADTIKLKRIAGDEGKYIGSFIAKKPNLNQIEIRLDDADPTKSVVIRRDIEVGYPQVEQQDRELNLSVLKNMSTESQGQFVNLEELAELPSWVPDKSEMQIIPQKPILLWDNWVLLVLLVFLLSAEWALRKIFKLL